MPYTDEFYNLLRKKKRECMLDVDIAFEKAVNEAVDVGIKPFRERKEKKSKFKKQKNATMPFLF